MGSPLQQGGTCRKLVHAGSCGARDLAVVLPKGQRIYLGREMTADRRLPSGRVHFAGQTAPKIGRVVSGYLPGHLRLFHSSRHQPGTDCLNFWSFCHTI